MTKGQTIRERMISQFKESSKAAEQQAEYQKIGVTEESFAKEMHFQVYRIENVLSGFDEGKLAALKNNESTKDILASPQINEFLGSLKNKQAGKFIEEAKTKTVDEREKLLKGVRKLIFKASAEVIKTAEQQKEIREEEEAVKNMLEAKLDESNIAQIENNLATPFNLKDVNNIGLNKLQNNYMTVMNGQRVFEHYIGSMQEHYKAAASKCESYNKRHTSGWKRRTLGVAYWIGRKLKPGKKGSTRVNQAIEPLRDLFNKDFEKFKNVKLRIDDRSKEIKEGLSLYKTEIRKKLKDSIAKFDFTDIKEKDLLKSKKELEKKEAELKKYLEGLDAKDSEINLARNNTKALNAELQKRYGQIEYGEESFELRQKAVEEKIEKLKKIYGEDSEQVRKVKETVLQPILDGKEKVFTTKLTIDEKIKNAEKDSQRFNLLQADVFVEKTLVVDDIANLRSTIDTKTKEVDQIKNTREHLKKMLENMEVGYVAVDEFKSSVDLNLDKMIDGNAQIYSDITAQHEAFKSLKVSEPGLFTSIWNTAVVGNVGFLGGLKFIANDLPRGVTGLVTGGKYKVGLGDITGKLYEGTEWVYDKAAGGNIPVLSQVAKIGAGLLKSAGGLVNGVGMILSRPDKVLQGLDSLTLKNLGKSLIHADEWMKNPFGALGQLGGDLVALFFTGGASSAKAAGTMAKAAGAGKLGVAWAGTKAFVATVARKTVTMPANIFYFLKDSYLALVRAGGAGLSSLGLFVNGTKNFLKNQTTKRGADAVEEAGKLLQKGGGRLSPELKGIADDLGKGGLGTKTPEELANIAKTLKDQIPGIKGWGAANAAEELLRAVNRQIATVGRLAKLELKLLSADKALEIVQKGGKNLTLENIRNAKRAVQDKIDDLIYQERTYAAYKNNPQLKLKRVKELKKQIKDIKNGPNMNRANRRKIKGIEDEIKILDDVALIDKKITRIGNAKADYIAKQSKLGIVYGEYSFIQQGIIKNLVGGSVKKAFKSTLDHFKNYKGQVLKSAAKDVFLSPIKFSFLLNKAVLKSLSKNPIIALKVTDIMKEFEKLEGLYEKKVKLEEKRLELLRSKEIYERSQASEVQGEIDEIEAQMAKIGELVEKLPDKIDIDPAYIKEIEETAQTELTKLIQNKSQIKPITK